MSRPRTDNYEKRPAYKRLLATGRVRDYDGTIRVKLRELAIARGIVHHTKDPNNPRNGQPNGYRIHMMTGISYATIHDLLKNDGISDHVGLNTVAKLCHTLNTTPQELLEFCSPGAHLEEYTLPQSNIPYQAPERNISREVTTEW